MLLSNLYRHIAFPGWNSMLSFLKTNMGTDPTRAKHQTMKIYIKALCFLNSEGYFSRLTTQKYRLTAIAAIVPRLLVPNAKISNAWKRQTVSSKIHLPWKRLATVKGIHIVDIRISLTASAVTNMLGIVRSLWLWYTAQKMRRFPRMATTLVIANKTVSVLTRGSVRIASSWKSVLETIILDQWIKKTGTATALETLKVQVSWETVELRRWESITG